ncbi:aldose epimerase family protein [Enterococcus sp. LJL128]
MKITQRDFGQGATLYSLKNENGVQLEVTNFGARIVNLFVPTKKEKRNIVLGFDSVEEYLAQDMYIGATIGRVAGRIKDGTFTLGGHTYQTDKNDHGLHTLHGGAPSFEAKLWDAKLEESEKKSSVIFSLKSNAGEHGFSGDLMVSVAYTLTEDNEWCVDYEAHSDQLTLFNPTNHVYFNLSGDVEQAIDDHKLFIDSDQFACIDEAVITTGEKRSVTDTAFDFRKARKLETSFNSQDDQVKAVGGFDHPFFLNKPLIEHVSAVLTSPDEAVQVEVLTDCPAVVVFTANFNGAGPVIRGKKLTDHGGITFETQTAPGAERFEDFGTIEIQPNVPFRSTTIYKITE